LKLLILDNYDSFTYNLVHLIEKVSDISFNVIRNDLLSPGPGLPKDAGIMPQLIRCYGSTKNILGVCLGLQAIGEAYGATLKNLDTVVHGIATPITIISEDILFKNCPKNFMVGRYHSWIVDSQNLPGQLKITAVDECGNIMALRHETYSVYGVQFHPESILSQYGEMIIKNWLEA
jgi:anthranilate synthase component 2